MTRLIKRARFNPEKTRRHLRTQDADLSQGVNLLFENSGACFRLADPGAGQSYILICQIAGYKPRYRAA